MNFIFILIKRIWILQIFRNWMISFMASLNILQLKLLFKFLWSIRFLFLLRRSISHLQGCLRPLLNNIIFIVIICYGWLHIISKVSLKFNLRIVRVIKLQFLLKWVTVFLNKLELLVCIRFILFIFFSELH